MPAPESFRSARLPWLSAFGGIRQWPWMLALTGVIVAGLLLPGGHNSQRLLELGLLLPFGGAMLLALLRRRWAGWQGGGAAAPLLLAFFALGTASGLRAFSPALAGYETGSLFLLLMLGIRVGQEVMRDCARSLLYALRVCGAGCATYSGLVLAVCAFALISGVQPDIADLTPGFSNHRFLNHVQTIALPMLVLLVVLDRPAGKAQPIWLCVTGFWWALLMLVGGRGTMVGLLAGVAAVCLLRRAHARTFYRALLFSALLGMAIYLLLFVAVPALRGMQTFGQLSELVARTANRPTSGREPLWQLAGELIAAHPWLGVGPLHYAHAASSAHLSAHPHNWVLQIAAEWGVPALLCLIGALAAATRGLLKTAVRIAPDDVRNQSILAAWIVTGAAILVDGMVSGLIVMPQSQLLIALYLGCATGWARSLYPAAPATASRSARLLTAVALAAALAAVLYPVWPALRGAGPDAAERSAPAPWNNIVHPRLWRNGYF